MLSARRAREHDDVPRPTIQSMESQLREALRPLLGQPGPVRAFGPGKSLCLFPTPSKSARDLLSELVRRQWLVVEPDLQDPDRVTLTEAGRRWLLESSDPRRLLEDYVTIAEAQRESLRAMEDECRRTRQALEQTLSDLRVIGARSEEPLRARLLGAIEGSLATGRADAPTLHELFGQLKGSDPTLSIGQFHDAVRALCEHGRLRLIPWTGPLYQLPAPELALLIGHEVLYYVQPCRALAS